MKIKTLEFLACNNRDENQTRCGGELTAVDELTLVCSRCGNKFKIQNGLPSKAKLIAERIIA